MTRSFRMSSLSFLSSPQPAKDCKISWSALQAHRCPDGVQRLPGEDVHLPGTSWCPQPGCARLILLLFPSLPQRWGGLASFPPSLWDLQLHVLPQFLLLPVRQWDTSYCDPQQTDLPVLGCSSWGLQLQEWSIDNEFWGCFSHDGVMLLVCNPMNWYPCSFSNSTNDGWILSCHKQL